MAQDLFLHNHNKDPNDDAVADAVADATDEHPANTANIANKLPAPS